MSPDRWPDPCRTVRSKVIRLRGQMACTDVRGILSRYNTGQIVARMLGGFSPKINSQKRKFLAILSADFGESLSDSS